MAERVIDADGAILGRLASMVAKKLLLGEKVTIINSEKAIISGNPEAIIRKYAANRSRCNPTQGPFYPRYPHTLIRRAIRGMLPYKKEKGRMALKNLRVHIGNNNKTGEKISKTSRDIRCKFITVGEVCEKLGAKKKWE